MGWGNVLLIQAFLTATVIGACKRAGWITVHPTKIRNENARKAFEAAIWVGDNVVNKSAGALGELKKLLPHSKDRRTLK